MPRPVILALAAPLVLWGCSGESSDPERNLLVEVDPFIGSGGLGFAVGSIAPGPTLPFGLAKPGPDTARNGVAAGFSHCAGYYWEDDQIRAFSQIRLSGTGVPDYGVLGLMPVTELEDGPIAERLYRASFDHRDEEASVGKYRVKLQPSGIDVTLSATARTAIYRFDYPQGAPARLVINHAHGLGGGRTLDGSISIDAGNKEVSGWVRHAGDLSARFGGVELYYVMRFDRAFEAEVSSRQSRSATVTAASGAEIGAVLTFEPGAGERAQVQIGLSFVDAATARENLDAEWLSFDLDAAVRGAEAAWAPILDKIVVEGGTSEERRTFYSALYHVYQMPTLFTESGRKYRGFDGQTHVAEGFTYYSDFSLWDTFRTAHPLWVLIDPALQRDFNRSLTTMAEQGGHLPRWPLATGNTWAMIGSHGETMLIDAWVKGVAGFDAELTYERVYQAAMGEVDARGSVRSGRECIGDYSALGYCALDRSGSGVASRTLENAYNDWLLSRLASGLGKTEQAAELTTRSGSWRNILDPATGFLRGRLADGTFPGEFDEEDHSPADYTEGNARQWLVYVPHDLAALAEATGGTGAFLDRVDRIFQGAAATEKTPLPDLWYWHGNEPDIHAAWIFAELGQPERTREWVRWVMDHRYDATPAGLDGNDDGGTLSAWYVFAALGFYPRVGTTQYILSEPRFPKAVLNLEGGATFTVRREGEGTTVDRVELDGNPLSGPFLEHEQLTRGGELVFYLR